MNLTITPAAAELIKSVMEATGLPDNCCLDITIDDKNSVRLGFDRNRYNITEQHGLRIAINDLIDDLVIDVHQHQGRTGLVFSGHPVNKRT